MSPNLTNKSIKKANEAIGIIPKTGKITAPMKKFYAALLLVAQNQKNQTRYRALLSDLTNLSGLPLSNRPYIADIVKRISDQSEWNINWQQQGELKTKNTKLIRPIDKPEFVDYLGNDAHQGSPTYFVWEFDERIRDRILNPINFWTKINLGCITKLRLGASINLYEIACQFETNRHGKNRLGSSGRKSLNQFWIPALLSENRTEYVYSRFKRDILLPAIEEINQETNLIVQIKEYKEGRRVIELECLIKNKYEQETLTKAEQGEDETTAQLRQMLLDWGVEDGQISRFIAQYSDLTYIQRHFSQAKAKERGGYSIQNKARYLASSLKNDFIESADSKPQRTSQAQVLFSSNKDLPIQEKKKGMAQQTLEEFLLLGEPTRKAIEREWLSQCSSNIFKSQYRAKRLETKVVSTAFSVWLLEQDLEKLGIRNP